MEKKLKFKLNKKIGIFIILAIILIVSIVGVLFYNKFEFNIVGNEREGAKAAGDAVKAQWVKTIGNIGDGINQSISLISGATDGSFIMKNGVNIIKYNSSGTQQWTKTITSTNRVEGTSDGGVVLVNDTNIIKYNSSGVQEWYRVLPSDGEFLDISATNDGGVIAVFSSTEMAGQIYARKYYASEISWTIDCGRYSSGLKTIKSTSDGGFFGVLRDGTIIRYDGSQQLK